MRRTLPLALVALLVLAGCSAAPAPEAGVGTAETPVEAASPTPLPEDAGVTVTVTRVVDGDTVEIEYENGTADTVRLLGVDTPEVGGENVPEEFEGVPETSAGADCLGRYGERASAYAEQRLEGERVTLVFDEQSDRRGYYGRLLGYVYDEGGNVNYDLLTRGLARVYDSEFTLSDRFYAAESRAQSAGVGLWGDCATEDPAATGTPTRTASDSGVVIATINADADGRDGENLNDEYVVLTNRGDAAVDLGGWTLADAVGKTYTVPEGTTLAAGASLTIHTGSGSDAETDLYWGADGPVWNNDGDEAILRDANGTVVARKAY